MQYLYGEFSDNQIEVNANNMHSEIHKLLLHKDPKFDSQVFVSEADYMNYFSNLLVRYGGLNQLLGEPPVMVSLMSALQAAYCEAQSSRFKYKKYRRLILDSHGYIKEIFGEE